MKPFKSDGCSMFPNCNWRECCEAHDRLYWQGGSKEDRLKADKLLYECVKSKGYPYIAKFMYYSVRIGGSPYLPLPWRWGFGYKYFKNYTS